MPSGPKDLTAEELAGLLLDALTLPSPPPLPARYASVPPLKNLHDYLLSLRDILSAASNGNLSTAIPLQGYLGGTLKTLQANLRHMTWQTRMVASGDFSQRVEFMGEFATSFNTMVEQLDRTVRELVSKKTELSRLNEELLKEIQARKATERALRKREKALRHMAITDALTGLYNRRHFNRLTGNAVASALRYGRPLSVMTFDVDFFKRVNDTFGHNNGDQVLKKVAQVTRETLRETDIPARYGGEEFIALLYETRAAQAADVAERLRKALQNTEVPSDKGPIRVTASFGVSEHLPEPPATSRDALVSAFVNGADRAMYTAKEGGRNRVITFDPEHCNPAQARPVEED